MKRIWPWPLIALLLPSAACTSPEAGAERGAAWSDTTAPTGTDTDGGTQGRTTCQNVVCDPNAACTGTGAGAECACLPGFEGDGVTCADIDECADPSLNDCDQNATCENAPAAFRCTCNPGFLGDGRTCTDVDECEGVANTCDPNGVCVNADSGFTCECKAGYTGDGFGCGDIDECADSSLFACASNASCKNTFGGFACACAPGFTGNGDTSCRSLCDAARQTAGFCADDGLCRVEARSAVCDACAPGTTGGGKTCTASASCQPECDGQGDDAEHVVCTASGDCACAPGYEGAVGSCANVDECGSNGGGCGSNAVCLDVDGGYLCDCAPGYELDASGACVDIDECAQTPAPCHPDATCTNRTPTEKPRGYDCACRPGFEGNGDICVDVDECATNAGGCTAPATCVNRRGSSTCECQPPLVGDAEGCYCDLSGIWAMRHDVDTCWKSRALLEGSSQNLISAGQMEATVWELHEITYDGSQFQLRGKGCGADNSPDLISPLFRETYSATVPLETYDALDLAAAPAFSQPGIIPGAAFSTPSFAAVLGIDLGSDPLNAPWPSSFDSVPASQWVDADGDGIPGFTLSPLLPSQITETGTRNYSYLPAKPALGGDTLYIAERAGCLSVAARVIVHWNVEVESCSRMVGEVVNEKTEGRVNSCAIVPKGTCDPANPNDCTGWKQDIRCDEAFWNSAVRCDDEDLSRLDDDQNQSQDSRATFEMIKLGAVGEAFTCVDVRDALPAIVRPVPTITCTTPP